MPEPSYTEKLKALAKKVAERINNSETNKTLEKWVTPRPDAGTPSLRWNQAAYDRYAPKDTEVIDLDAEDAKARRSAEAKAAIDKLKALQPSVHAFGEKAIQVPVAGPAVHEVVKMDYGSDPFAKAPPPVVMTEKEQKDRYTQQMVDQMAHDRQMAELEAIRAKLARQGLIQPQ